MRAILLSVKPEFVYKMISGEKRYEFRRRLCSKPIQKLYLYATSPVRLVLAEAEVEAVIWEEREELWAQTSAYAGIDRGFFEQYFDGCDKAGAYCLGRVTSYINGRPLSEFGIKAPPQSFVYLNE